MMPLLLIWMNSLVIHLLKAYNGLPQKAIGKDKFDSKDKILINFMNGGEDIMTYNDLIDIYNDVYDDGEKL